MEGFDMTKNELIKQCGEMKIKTLEIALNSGSFGAHIGGAFSLMEIMTAIYETINPSVDSDNRDKVILSKGHGALALYTALWKNGLISEAELNTFDTLGTKFHVHPHMNRICGIDASTGSLGLGFSFGVGIATALKKKSSENRVFIILGDGECDEGIVWEAAMSAAHYHLDNITVIVDLNGLQVDGETKTVMDSQSLAEKFKSFGFDVDEINGHNIEELLNALSKKHERPNTIIAHTIKANGISFLENNKNSHQCSLTKKKYEQAVMEIKQAYGME